MPVKLFEMPVLSLLQNMSSQNAKKSQALLASYFNHHLYFISNLIALVYTCWVFFSASSLPHTPNLFSTWHFLFHADDICIVFL